MPPRSGSLPALISDPGYLTGADLIRLLPVAARRQPQPATAPVPASWWRRAAGRAAPCPHHAGHGYRPRPPPTLGFPNLRQSLVSSLVSRQPRYGHTPWRRPLGTHTRPQQRCERGDDWAAWTQRRDVIVTISHDQTVRIWGQHRPTWLATRQLHRPHGTGWEPAGMIGSPDGRDVIVSGNGDQTVRICGRHWSSPLGDPLHRPHQDGRGPRGGSDNRTARRHRRRPNDQTSRIWDDTGAPLGD